MRDEPAIRHVTEEERATYVRDGVVCLRGVFSTSLAQRLLGLYDETIVGAERAARHQQLPVHFQPLVFASQIPRLVGELVGARSVGFFWSEMFEKEPRNARSTPWHHDAAGWYLRGEHIVGVWVALTPVVEENGLECIAGSHYFPELYWAETPNGHRLPPPPDRPRCPDFEARRGDPSLRFLSWTMAPGDALFVHPRTLHYSCGNRTPDQRRVALGTWWHGDDLVWDPRPECGPYPVGIDPAAIRAGERPSGESIPVLWRAEA
jgi:ectoine hydroxylase-related dioxygenase (phytanoyl-CoA dioxygenase family)